MRWRRPRRELDVVVVGAGFSGLAAASALVEAGLEVVVLEAQDRVGGRTWTVEADGTWIELGGMWTGPGQPRLAALLEEHGLATFPQPEEGVALLASGGYRHGFMAAGAAMFLLTVWCRWGMGRLRG